jgi:ATP-dependent helicase HrpB
LGRRLARLPVHPRLGRLLLEGQRLGQPERVAMAAALLSERDPFTRSLNEPPAGPPVGTHSDVLDRVDALEEFARSGRLGTPLGTLNRNAARMVLRAREQLVHELQRLERRKRPARTGSVPHHPDADEAVARALLAAFPDRVARRREPRSPRGVMVGGRGVRLAPSSGVREAELFLCIDVDAGRAESLVRQASAIEREWLPADRLHTGVEVEFDPEGERVTARKRLRFEDLVLEETLAALPGDEETARVLAAAAAAQPERVLPPADSPAGMYRLRVQCLRLWLPELGLPPFDDDDLRKLLPWLCQGCRSYADLRNADWLSALQSRLTHTQRQAIEREAPERLQVPSGSRITLRYEVGRPPVLAVRIQEMFGLNDTPRVAGGRVRVLLHLLAPNYRPQQVTDDLASFWANTYPQVRKELRARYPRHAWPEDPWNAPPESRPRRRPH